MAMCSTCQCYAIKDVNLPRKGEAEEVMLAKLLHVKHNSRLSCQISIVQELDGLEIAMAPMM
jgi:ferredoxin-2, mitochondrial